MARCGLRSRLSSPRPERTRGVWKEDPILGARVPDVAPSLATRCGAILPHPEGSRAGWMKLAPGWTSPATTRCATPARRASDLSGHCFEVQLCRVIHSGREMGGTENCDFGEAMSTAPLPWSMMQRTWAATSRATVAPKIDTSDCS